MALQDIFKYGAFGSQGPRSFLKGSKDQFKQVSRATPEQQIGLQQYFQNPINQNPLYQQGSSYLQNLLGGDQASYDRFAAPYMQQFEQQIVPGIAERFAGMGTGGSLSSSGLNQSLARAGENLQTNLAGLQSQRQLQGAQLGLGYAQQPYSNLLGGLGVQQFENIYQPRQPGLQDTLMQMLPYIAMAML